MTLLWSTNVKSSSRLLLSMVVAARHGAGRQPPFLLVTATCHVEQDLTAGLVEHRVMTVMSGSVCRRCVRVQQVHIAGLAAPLRRITFSTYDPAAQVDRHVLRVGDQLALRQSPPRSSRSLMLPDCRVLSASPLLGYRHVRFVDTQRTDRRSCRALALRAVVRRARVHPAPTFQLSRLDTTV